MEKTGGRILRIQRDTNHLRPCLRHIDTNHPCHRGTAIHIVQLHRTIGHSSLSPSPWSNSLESTVAQEAINVDPTRPVRHALTSLVHELHHRHHHPLSMSQLHSSIVCSTFRSQIACPTLSQVVTVIGPTSRLARRDVDVDRPSGELAVDITGHKGSHRHPERRV